MKSPSASDSRGFIRARRVAVRRVETRPRSRHNGIYVVATRADETRTRHEQRSRTSFARRSRTRRLGDRLEWRRGAEPLARSGPSGARHAHAQRHRGRRRRRRRARFFAGNLVPAAAANVHRRTAQTRRPPPMVVVVTVVSQCGSNAGAGAAAAAGGGVGGGGGVGAG